MTAVDLAGRAQSNLIDAQQQMAGRDLVVSGTVQATTLAPRDRVKIQPGWGGPSASVAQEQLALVVLQPGTVLCYFEPSDIEHATGLKAGDSVSLTCRVDSFRPGTPAAVAVLSGCRQSGRW